MSDSSDDIECMAAALFCTKCNEHFEDCKCEDNSGWEIIEY